MFLKGTRHLLQSIQLCDAIGSPAAAEHRQNQRRIGQKLGRAHLLPKRVLQRERRQRMAHFDDAVHDARRAQIIRRTRLSVGIRLSAPCRMVSSRSASISRSSSSRPLSLTGGPADPCQLKTVLRRAANPRLPFTDAAARYRISAGTHRSRVRVVVGPRCFGNSNDRNNTHSISE
jgi:hypothetical protein